jgi:hypothetical protein
MESMVVLKRLDDGTNDSNNSSRASMSKAFITSDRQNHPTCRRLYRIVFSLHPADFEYVAALMMQLPGVIIFRSFLDPAAFLADRSDTIFAQTGCRGYFNGLSETLAAFQSRFLQEFRHDFLVTPELQPSKQPEDHHCHKGCEHELNDPIV